jgi:phosphatidylglycerol lysyltransferase
MELLLLRYGYLLLFVGVVLEGEAFLIAGSLLANRGYFEIPIVAAVALAANTLGSQFYYMAARMRGRSWFENRFAGKESYQCVFDWMARYGNWLLVLSRFAFGFRIVIPAACGALGMPMARFLVLNLLSGILWVLPTVLLGFYLGDRIESLFQQAYHYAGTVILVAVPIAVAFLVVRRLHGVRSVFQKLQWGDLHAVVPSLMGFMGILNIVTAIWPGTDARFEGVQRWLPLEATEESRAVMLFAGIALLQVTRSLALRKELAWYVAVFMLSISLVLHLVPNVDVGHSIVAGLLLAYLVHFRRRFYTRSDPVSIRKGLLVMPLLGLIVFLYGVTGLYATYSQFTWPRGVTPVEEAFRSSILILSPKVIPETQYAARFLGSLHIGGWIARVYVLLLLLRPVILRDRQEAPPEDVDRIFRHYGRDSVAALAVRPDKHHLLLQNGQALIAYAWKGSIALACGDPIAADDIFPAAVREYRDYCLRHAWKPCICLAAERWLPVYQSLEFGTRKVAEEAIIDLSSWKASPEPTVQRYDRAREPDALIDEQLEEVSEDWLHVHHVGEMGFSLGRFTLESLGKRTVFILGNRYRVDAFCAWLPYRNGSAMVLDLIRQRHTAIPGAMQLLLEQALIGLQIAGVEQVSVSASVLGREALAAFSPVWENRYLVYPAGAKVGRIMKTLASIQRR